MKTRKLIMWSSVLNLIGLIVLLVLTILIVNGNLKSWTAIIPLVIWFFLVSLQGLSASNAIKDKYWYDAYDDLLLKQANADRAWNNATRFCEIVGNQESVKLWNEGKDYKGNPYKSFQDQVGEWVTETFGTEIATDKKERCHRLIEEVAELVQTCNYPLTDAIQIFNSVYARKKGAIYQEIGGTMVTLAALCCVLKKDMHDCGDVEFNRINNPETQKKIRAKHALKFHREKLPESFKALLSKDRKKEDGNTDNQSATTSKQEV
jgi:hypothetical protein